jgi:hypothetical protein
MHILLYHTLKEFHWGAKAKTNNHTLLHISNGALKTEKYATIYLQGQGHQGDEISRYCVMHISYRHGRILMIL